jgi:hypothetical protein
LPVIEIPEFLGYNTAEDETRLDPRFSAAAAEFDISDSGALVQRTGSRFITQASGAGASGSPVNAMCRYPQKDGDWYWIVAQGDPASGIYQKQDTDGSETPWTELEAEDITDGSVAEIDYPLIGLSEGRIVEQTGSSIIEYTIPAATYVNANIYSSASFPSSAKPQAAAWAEATSVPHVPAWSAGSGILQVKAHNPSASALFLSSTVNGTEIRRTYDLGDMDVGGHRVIEFYAAHKGGANSRTRVELSMRDAVSGTPATNFWFVADQLSATWKFGYGGSGLSTEAVADTGVAKGTPIYFLAMTYNRWLNVYYRTALGSAWTLFYTTYLVPQAGGFPVLKMRYLELVSKDTGDTSGSYLDALYTDALCVYDGADTTGWVGTTPSGTSASVASTYADTTPRVYIDTFGYGYFSTWTNVRSGVSAADGLIGMELFDDKMWLSFPATGMAYSDGGATLTAASESASAQYGGLLWQNQRRFFIARKDADKGYLAYSATLPAAGNEPDFGAGATFPLKGISSGGDIMAGGIWDDILWLLTPSELHMAYIRGSTPSSDWYTKLITPAVGCKASKSFVTTPNGFAWLASDGAIRAFGRFYGLPGADGTGTIELSADIAPTVRANLSSSTVAAHHRGRLWFIDGTTAYVYVLPDPDTKRRGAWLPPFTYPFSVTCLYVTRADDPLGYGLFAGTSQGHIVQLDTGTTDAASFESGSPTASGIAASWRIPYLAPGGYHTTKHFREVWVAAYAPDAQTVTVTPDTDDVASPAASLAAGPDTKVTPIRAELSSFGAAARYTIATTGTGTSLEVSRFIVHHDHPRE